MKRKLPILAIAGTIGLVGLGGATAASAYSGSSDSSLIDRLVEKFNLDKSEVEAVFDEVQTARETERQAEMSQQLQSAVDDGDITAEQKTAIEAKLKELQDARKTERTALETWAEDNDIDMKYLMGGGRDDNDDRLQKAVDDGDLTDAQKKLIEDKRSELKAARDKQHSELKARADDNDIDMKYLMMGGMRGGHGHGGMERD